MKISENPRWLRIAPGMYVYRRDYLCRLAWQREKLQWELYYIDKEMKYLNKEIERCKDTVGIV